jgi:hypothetical protein
MRGRLADRIGRPTPGQALGRAAHEVQWHGDSLSLWGMAVPGSISLIFNWLANSVGLRVGHRFPPLYQKGVSRSNR